MKALFPIFTLALFLATAPVRADAGSVVEARFHAAVNGVVQEVRDAKTPVEKREILRRLAARVEEGLEQAQSVGSLNDADRRSLAALQKKFVAFHAELDGEGGFARVSDAELDAFAAYIQQDLEQAAAGGGVYISGGALLILIILLIVLL
jgi:hypothetical protein